GDGTFSAHSTGYAVGQYPYSLAIADLNADGILDLAVANGGSGTVSILIGHGAAGVGNGSFAPAVGYLAGAQPRFVAAGDIDGDGILDLAVADYAGSVNVLSGAGSAGTGNGTFGAPVSYPAGSAPTFVTLGDFNHDGGLDAAVANYVGTSVSVLLRGCAPPPPPPPPPAAPTLTRVRDVPHDEGGFVFLTWLRSGL